MGLADLISCLTQPSHQGPRQRCPIHSNPVDRDENSMGPPRPLRACLGLAWGKQSHAHLLQVIKGGMIWAMEASRLPGTSL